MKMIEEAKRILDAYVNGEVCDCDKCQSHKDSDMRFDYETAMALQAHIKKLESTKEAYAILHKMVVERLGKIVYCEDCAYYDNGYCINAVCFTDGVMHSGIYKREPEDYCCDGKKEEAEE